MLSAKSGCQPLKISLRSYFHGRCSDELFYLVPTTETFKGKIHLVTSTVLNHRHSLAQELLLCGTDSHVDASPSVTILASSSLGTIVIYPLYPHNFHFLIPPRTPISHILPPWNKLSLYS